MYSSTVHFKRGSLVSFVSLVPLSEEGFFAVGFFLDDPVMMEETAEYSEDIFCFFFYSDVPEVTRFFSIIFSWFKDWMRLDFRQLTEPALVEPLGSVFFFLGGLMLRVFEFIVFT